MNVDIHLECPVERTFRLESASALFDVPPGTKSSFQLSVEVPGLDEPWMIGAIVGPSGSGKSTVARKAFGEYLYDVSAAWPVGKSILDGFPPELSVKQITSALTSVGLSSPKCWLLPYAVLSTGQKFRCDLARAIALPRNLVAFDEFSSVVDRTVAKIGSAAAAKAIRSRRGVTRFVAITCHNDVLEWLEPDWVLDLAGNVLARGGLHRRPPIQLDVVRCSRDAWSLFSHHHYLTSDLHRSAQCFMALWGGYPVAFCAMLSVFGYENYWRVSRAVTLPDYQGIGIGTHLIEWCCQNYREAGRRVSIVGSHPAILRHCEKSALWQLRDVKLTGNRGHGGDGHKRNGRTLSAKTSTGRTVASFEYIGS